VSLTSSDNPVHSRLPIQDAVATTSIHRWRFFRAGGFDQVKICSGLDLANLDSLDQKLWVALACPTRGLDFDPRTTELIDTDKDGRIRVPELIAAAKFACENLKRPDDLLDGATELPLAAINDDAPGGKTLLAAARQVLINLGRSDATSISVEVFADPVKLFSDTIFNGDGVIIVESAADDEEAKRVIGEVATSIGQTPDRSGKLGVSQAQIEAFFAGLREQDAWFKEGEANPGVFFLGRARTEAAAQALSAVSAKVDDYFARTRVAAFDPRTPALLNRSEEAYQEIFAGEMTLAASELGAFPLSRIEASRPLPLTAELNPAYSSGIAALRRDTIEPMLGERAALTEAEWLGILERFAPYLTWQADQRGEAVSGLGIERVREILVSGVETRVAELVANDLALEPEATAIDSLERLVRYHRDLYRLCRNFVSFEDFYEGKEPASFQLGTLYLDQRACHLCLPVDDPARHVVMAGLAGAYLAYLDCARTAPSEKMQIVAAFTAGDSDNLMIGRNGVFYDRKGRDWDATITKIIDNPISVRQAFFAPYKKLARLIEEQVAKRASAADASANQQLGHAAATTVNLDKNLPPTAPTAPPAAAKKLDIGTVAALGVAFGAIGSFLTAIVGYATGVFRLGIPATAGAFLAVVLIISMPSVVMAYLKLRKRNLGPILDSNGWAINTRARINVPFGATLTAVPKLPPGSRRDLQDRFAEKKFPWRRLVVFLALIALGVTWYQGKLDRHLPERARSARVLGSWAP
jgi:hypothetical protein